LDVDLTPRRDLVPHGLQNQDLVWHATASLSVVPRSHFTPSATAGEQ
jgi:hypothetical protein